tara:strand:- start:74 stop:247 length:174 start_codon:yes stop_codon:yes gene_type:complete
MNLKEILFFPDLFCKKNIGLPSIIRIAKVMIKNKGLKISTTIMEKNISNNRFIINMS